MSWLLPLLGLLAVEAVTVPKPHFEPLSDELIRYVNEESGALWRAGPSTRFTDVNQFKQLLGTRFETEEEKTARRPTIRHNVVESSLPAQFDARETWSHCLSISEVRDQSSCGSCWAFGATEAMTDRTCIHSHGNFTADLSAADLMSCCTDCGDGCEGGYPGQAWDYWMEEGIVTGGSLENPTGCWPYPFSKCAHHMKSKTLKPCPKDLFPTPECSRKCQDSYKRSYSQDKVYGKSSYNVFRDEKDIMQEIMTNGPVEAAFFVYEDFMSYKGGIYHHVAGHMLGGHAIRLLGWGVENGHPYWLLANSWNEEWGEKGYFRILRGRDECGIESSIVAGMPRV